MRSLPVLLIAPALLTLSDAIECYAKTSASGFPADLQKKFDAEAAALPKQMKCAAGVDACLSGSGSGHGASIEAKGCVPGGYTCEEVKCETKEKRLPGWGKTMPITSCCCKGNLCNPAAGGPTVLLISFAAAAAVLAARI